VKEVIKLHLTLPSKIYDTIECIETFSKIIKQKFINNGGEVKDEI